MVARTTRWVLLGALTALTVAGCGGGNTGDGGLDDVTNADADGGMTLLGDAGDVARGDGDVITQDTGSTDVDSGSTDVDSGSTDVDSGSTDVDSGSTDVDSGSTDVDSGSTDMDSGSTDVDSGSTDVDSGSTDVDSGMPMMMGDNCANAAMITPGTLMGDLATLAADFTSTGTSCQSSSGADAVYVIKVGPNERLSATVTPSSGLDPVMHLVDATACTASPLACLQSADSGSSGDPETLTYTNTGTADQYIDIIVASYDASPTSTDFTLTTTVTALPPPGAGETCASAQAITPGTLTGESLAGMTADRSFSAQGGCTTASGSDKVYAITVPAGQRLTTSVNSTSDLAVNMIAGTLANCTASSPTCVGSSDSVISGTETTTHTNTGTADETVYIVVAAYSSTTSTATYTLTTALDTPPPPSPGDNCASATAITPGTLTGEPLDGFAADQTIGADANGCQRAVGSDRVYSIVIPAGQRLVAAANSSSDLVVNLIAGPASNCTSAPTCLAGSDSGNPETVSYLNNGTSDITAYIIVAAYSNTTSTATFDLTTTLVTPTTGGETCAMPTAITTPGTIPGESLTGFTHDTSITSSNGCRSYTGADHIYSIVVPAGKRLDVSLNGGFDSVLDLVAGPDTNCTATSVTCLAGSDSGNPEHVTWLNASSTDQTVFIVAAAYSSSGNNGTYSLTTSVTTPPPDDACGGATVIPTPGTFTAQDLTGYVKDYSLSGNGCQSYSGAERVYSFTVPAGKRVTVTATPTVTGSTGLNPVLDIIPAPASNCSASTVTCVASANAASTGAAETAQYTNYTTADQTILIVVASSSSTPGDTGFTLDTVIDTPSIGDNCASAQMITMTGTLPMEDLAGFAHDYGTTSDANGCQGEAGPDRVYSMVVPPGQKLTVTGVGATGLDLVIDLAPGSACASPLHCTAGADSSGSGGTETVSYSNSGSTAQTVNIVVGSYGSTPTATTYSLTTALAPVAMDEICGTATALAAPGTLTGQDLAGFTRDYVVSTANGCQSYSGAERVYSITVPAGKQLNTTVVGGTGFNPVVEIVAGADGSICDAAPLTCATSANATSTAGTENTHWVNSSTSDVTAYIIVASSSSSPTGTTFTLTTDVSTPATGDACGIAQPIMPGTLSAENLTGYFKDYTITTANGCRSYSGVDRVYSLTIPAGKELTASVVGGTGFDPVINIVSASGAACGASPIMCLASANATSTAGTENVVWLNTGTTDQTVYVIVSSSSSTPTGTTYSLTTTVDYPPAGDTCTDPTVIASSGTLTGETLLGYTRNYGPSSDSNGCQGYSGVDHVYSMVVPAGSTLNVMVTPAFDAVLDLIAGPATNCTTTPTCVAGADDPENASYTNSTGSDQTIFIVVSAYSSSFPSTPTYSLTTSLTP